MIQEAQLSSKAMRFMVSARLWKMGLQEIIFATAYLDHYLLIDLFAKPLILYLKDHGT